MVGVGIRIPLVDQDWKCPARVRDCVVEVAVGRGSVTGVCTTVVGRVARLSKRDLALIREARRTSRHQSCLAESHQYQRQEQRDDPDNDQQFHQGKSTWPITTITARMGVGVRHLVESYTQ